MSEELADISLPHLQCMKPGGVYQWDENCDLSTPIADAPSWLIDLIKKPKINQSQQAFIDDTSFIEGNRNNSLTSVAGKLSRNGITGSDLYNKLTAINQRRCSPPLSAEEVYSIANSVESYNNGGIVWTAPDSVEMPKASPAELTKDMLPSVIADWAFDIAKRLDGPADFAAIAIITALSSLIAKRLTVRPKKYDSWTVTPNLWGLVVASPGALKSPAFGQSLLPLKRLQSEATRSYNEDAAEYSSTKSINETKVSGLKANLKKATKEGAITDQIESEIKALDLVEPPTLIRYETSDTTIEKLGEILSQQPTGILVFRDELAGWFKSFNKDGRENDRSFFLEAWNGDSHYTFDRISRGTVAIDGLCISMLGGIQPGVFQSHVINALKNSGHSDGLVQRYQLLVWPETSGKWKCNDESPDEFALERLSELFFNVANDNFGFEPQYTDSGKAYIQFSDEAQTAFICWLEHWENEVVRKAEHPAIEAHLSKYKSLVPSLALIFHACNSSESVISLSNLNQALRFTDYLRTHADRIFNEIVHSVENTAKLLSDKIKQGKLGLEFKQWEIEKKGWSGVSKHEIPLSLELLEQKGWLQSHEKRTGGRPSVIFNVNPALLENSMCA